MKGGSAILPSRNRPSLPSTTRPNKLLPPFFGEKRMTNLPGSPRIVHGGFVIIGPHSLQPARIIPFQYNPETLSRTLSPGAPATSGSTGPSGTAGVASLGTALGPVAALGTLLGTGAEQPSADR